MDDLNGADVARKLTILSRMLGGPLLDVVLPHGYRSVDTRSLVPSELTDVVDGTEFMRRLPEFDAPIARLREDAAREGCVLRYVGVIDVESKIVRASLEK